MEDYNRRKLLKMAGASSFMISGASGAGAAHSSSEEGLDFEKEELNRSEMAKYLNQVWSAEPTKEMRDFLQKEKQVTVNPSVLNGYEVTTPNGDRFILLRTPFATAQKNGPDLVLQLHNDTVSASVTVDGTPYKSNPVTIGSHPQSDDFNSEQAAPEGYNIVTGLEWASYKQSLKNSGSLRTMSSDLDCERSVTLDWGSLDVPTWLCDLVALVGSITFMVLPEPSSSAAGIAAVTMTALGGGCSVAYKMQDETEADLSGVTICAINLCGWIEMRYGGCELDFAVYDGSYS